MGRRKPGLDVRSRAGSAWGGSAYLVARLHAVAVPGARSHTAECIFPVVVPAAAVATKLPAGHGMINVADLHVLTTVTSRGRDAWIGASPPSTGHPLAAQAPTAAPKQGAVHTSNQDGPHTARLTPFAKHVPMVLFVFRSYTIELALLPSSFTTEKVDTAAPTDNSPSTGLSNCRLHMHA